MTTVAAIDCGTNTIKLLIGELPDVAVRETRLVRLGQGVDATGRLADEALDRAFAALDEYADLIHRNAVDRIRFCATSATRDAENSAVFTQGVRDRIGVAPEVLSGSEEARLSFDGAVRHLRRTPDLPVLVVDIGGGSTELVLGSSLTEPPDAADSMDIGSVRMHERHLRSDPPTAEEVAAATRDIDAHLDRSPVDLSAVATGVGVAGTVTSVAAGVLGLGEYSRDEVDQAELPVDQVHALVERLLAMSIRQRLELPWLHPGRADVIGAGALILSRTLRRTPLSHIVASEADILEGIAWSMVG
jgi:exopolyphosphatase/guanosine-5'-triphosphate,3'-diphosphate pyrophosphatase